MQCSKSPDNPAEPELRKLSVQKMLSCFACTRQILAESGHPNLNNILCFSTETMGQMIVRLFEEGDDVDYGRKPSSNTFALSQNEFYHAGEFMAMSVMHGGPAPNFLAKWVFKMICDGETSALKERVKIPLNHKWKSVVDKVREVFCVQIRDYC